MKYTLCFYEKPGKKQITEIINSKHEESLIETITEILDTNCNDPERMYNLTDQSGVIILTEEILPL